MRKAVATAASSFGGTRDRLPRPALCLPHPQWLQAVLPAIHKGRDAPDLDAHAGAQLYLWANPCSKVCIEIDQAIVRSLVHRPGELGDCSAPLLVVVPREGIVILTLNPGGRWPRSNPLHRDRLVPERTGKSSERLHRRSPLEITDYLERPGKGAVSLAA
jgi:hypothetical protein